MADALLLHLPDVALAAALAWGAGLRLYLVVFLIGLAGRYLGWPLPEHLHALASPIVLFAAGFMALLELFADKLPWLDSVWDAIHTLIRIPAGAALAAAVFGDSGAGTAIAVGLLGGTLTATTHFAKAGARAAVNTSPEPFSNLALSIAEDVAVTGGTWLAVAFPAVFLVLLVVFLFAAVLLLRWLAGVVRRVRRRRRPSISAP